MQKFFCRLINEDWQSLIIACFKRDYIYYSLTSHHFLCDVILNKKKKKKKNARLRNALSRKHAKYATRAYIYVCVCVRAHKSSSLVTVRDHRPRACFKFVPREVSRGRPKLFRNDCVRAPEFSRSSRIFTDTHVSVSLAPLPVIDVTLCDLSTTLQWSLGTKFLPLSLNTRARR